MSRVKRNWWWPLLLLLFPIFWALVFQIKPWVEGLWNRAEPLRLQHAALTGRAHNMEEYQWLVIRVSFWNSLLLASILFVFIRYKFEIQQHLNRWWNEQVSLGRLAIYRILVYGGLLALIIQNHPASMSLLPDELQEPPWLWSFIKGTWLLEPELVSIVSLLAQATSIAAMIGFRGSLSAKIATISSFFVLLVPQSYGKVDHYHLWWWAALLLAWSPAWKVWSVDAWVAKMKGEKEENPRSDSSFKGLFWLGLLIIMAYVFPGLWKWAWNGPLWATPNAMKAIAYNQWSVLPESPVWKPTSDWMWMILSGWVLIFELTFPLIILGPKWRKAYILMAMGFHLGVYLTLGIAFWHLGLLLILIWPYKNPSGSFEERNESVPWKSPWAWVVGVFIGCGVSYFDTWPVGVYPGFSAALAQKVQTITLKKQDEVVWEMYKAPWGVGNRILNPSRKMGIVTQMVRVKGEVRNQKLKALRLFLSSGPDSLLFKDENLIFDLDLKNSGPDSPN